MAAMSSLRGRGADLAVISVGGFVAVASIFGVRGAPNVTVVAIWQWSALGCAAAFWMERASRRVMFLAVALSIAGSAVVIADSLGASGFWLYGSPLHRFFMVESQRSTNDSGKLVALMCGTQALASWVVLDLPSVAASRRLRMRVGAAFTMLGIGGAVVGLIAAALPVSLEAAGALFWIGAAFTWAAATTGLIALWVAFQRTPKPVGWRWRLTICAALSLLIGLLFTSWLSVPLRLDLTQAAGLSVLPLAASAIMIRDLPGPTRTRQLRRLLEVHESPEQLESVLRLAFGDEALRLSLFADRQGHFVDVAGRIVPNSELAPPRTQLVKRDGATIAALHWSDANDNTTRASSLLDVATLAIEKARLQAEVLAQLNDLTESRRRLVEATDRARHSVERDLHDGAQQRLTALLLTLRIASRESATNEASALADQAAAELALAIGELQDLARGIHPAVLTDAGLRAAVESLAERAPFPTMVDVVDHRFDPAIELTAYYVVAEALTNVAKHTSAADAVVRIRDRAGSIVVTISDSGGGAVDVTRGTGLQGLADRVAAVGGTLEVMGGLGGRTVVEATLPVGGPRNPI